MIFRMSAVPNVAVGPSVSIIAKSDSGSVLLWDGPWVTIRHFLDIHLLSDYDISTIEGQLTRGAEQGFEVQSSEILLSLAGFRPKRS